MESDKAAGAVLSYNIEKWMYNWKSFDMLYMWVMCVTDRWFC